MRHVFPMVVISLAVLTGCGEPDVALWGSIDEMFSLEFDRQEILKQGSSLIIDYVKELGGGAEESPCKMVVETLDLVIVPNSELKGDAFDDGIVTVERIAASGGDFPNVEGGTLYFEDYEFVDGGLISGNFTVLFENGRNLFGNFRANVELIE